MNSRCDATIVSLPSLFDSVYLGPSVFYSISIFVSLLYDSNDYKWVRKCHHIWLHVFDDADDKNDDSEKKYIIKANESETTTLTFSFEVNSIEDRTM